jgi:peroxiredoxin
MINFQTKISVWFVGVMILFNLTINHSFAENSMIIKPESSFIPDTHFFNEEGEKVFLDQFEGKTILLCFWATWCGPCTEELPSLDILQKDFRKLPFEVVTVSEDFNGIEPAKNHFNKYGIRHLKLYHDYKNELFRAMSVIGLPTAFLIDPDGKIKVIFRGNTKWHEGTTREIILSEIAGNPVMPKNSYITTSLNKKIAPIATNTDTDKPKTDNKEEKQPELTNQTSQETQNENNQQK